MYIHFIHSCLKQSGLLLILHIYTHKHTFDTVSVRTVRIVSPRVILCVSRTISWSCLLQWMMMCSLELSYASTGCVYQLWNFCCYQRTQFPPLLHCPHITSSKWLWLYWNSFVFGGEMWAFINVWGWGEGTLMLYPLSVLVHYILYIFVYFI